MPPPDLCRVTKLEVRITIVNARFADTAGELTCRNDRLKLPDQ